MRSFGWSGWRFAAAVALTLLTVQGIDAQLNQASVTGTVRDSSGAVVADVDVAAKNAETGQTTRGKTNHDGIYSILNLTPGPYSL